MGIIIISSSSIIIHTILFLVIETRHFLLFSILSRFQIDLSNCPLPSPLFSALESMSTRLLLPFSLWSIAFINLANSSPHQLMEYLWSYMYIIILCYSEVPAATSLDKQPVNCKISSAFLANSLLSLISCERSLVWLAGESLDQL